jgi:hypothetical protein
VAKRAEQGNVYNCVQPDILFLNLSGKRVSFTVLEGNRVAISIKVLCLLEGILPIPKKISALSVVLVVLLEACVNTKNDFPAALPH